MLCFFFVCLNHLQLPKHLPLQLPLWPTLLWRLQLSLHHVSPCPHPQLLLGHCSSFLLQCSLVFDLQPSTYSSDEPKIAFVVNHLSGRAAQWANVVNENHAHLSVRYEPFVAELRGMYNHPVQGGEAVTRLFSSCQGYSSVADYSIHFGFTQ